MQQCLPGQVFQRLFWQLLDQVQPDLIFYPPPAINVPINNTSAVFFKFMFFVLSEYYLDLTAKIN